MRPYYLQPMRFFPYLGEKRYIWPKSITTELYLSFEDALWDLLPRLGVRRGAKILVPRFYCKDVVQNMIAHGYKVVGYPVNEDLTCLVSEILKVVDAEQPDVFIDFQYTGIKNTLLSDIERKLDFRTLVVSDRVHEIVHPHIDYFPNSDRHVILSSYRKVTAFPGSLAVYTRNARKSQNKQQWMYILRVLIKWAKVLTLLKLSYILSSQRIGMLAENAMQSHNDLIGDAQYSHALPDWLKRLYEHIAIEKIALSRIKQCELYCQELQDINAACFKLFPLSVSDYEKLQGFPLVITNSKYTQFLAAARKLGLLRHYQIEDLNNAEVIEKIVLLPLGPHLTDSDIREIAKRVRKALTTLI